MVIPTSLDGAVSLARAGKLAEAEVQCRAVLGKNPDTVEALHLLGVLRTMAGEFAEAERLLRRAVALGGNLPKYFNNLGNACKAQGKLDEAIEAYRTATELDAGYVDGWYNLGIALAENGAPEEAVKAYARVLEKAPLHFEAINNQGLVQMRLGRYPEAAVSFRRAAEVNGSVPGIWYNLGLSLKLANEMDAAQEAFLRAVALRGDYVEALLEAAEILQQHNEAVEAIRLYERVQALQPNDMRMLSGLAWLYESTNQLDALEPVLSRGLELDRQNPLLNLVRAKCLRRAGDTAEAVKLLAFRDWFDVREDLAAAIYHELGQAYDRMTESDKAYTAFSNAKQMLAGMAKAKGVDKSTYLDRLERAKSGFEDGDLVRRTPLMLSPLQNPLTFIVGFPRSGTTLLDQVLDSHPAARTMEERPILAMVREQISEDPYQAIRALADISVSQANELRALYMEAAREVVALSPGEMLVDKFPLNIIWVPLIHRLFPEAKIVLALRHPCDASLSCFMQLFTLNDAMANFFTFRDAAHMYSRVMGLWRLYVEQLPLNYHRIRYEDVVQDFRGEIGRMLDFVGLPWDDAVEKFYEHAQKRGKINTPSYHQVAEPIYSRAAYRWERYRRHLTPDLPVLVPFAEYFGYGST